MRGSRSGPVAVPVPHRDHARRHELEAIEETQDLLQRVDVYPRGRVRRGERLRLGRAAGTDGDDHVAAGCDGPGKGGGHVAGDPGLGKVQDPRQDHACGLGHVDQFRQPGIGQNAPGLAHIARYRDHPWALGQQVAGVQDHDRVVVHVRYPRFRVDAPGDLVRVHRGRQAGTDVDELPDPASRHIADGTHKELPVLPGHLRGDRVDRQHRLRKLAVGREVFHPAQPVVPDSGDVRPGRVEWLHRYPSLCHPASHYAGPRSPRFMRGQDAAGPRLRARVRSPAATL